MAVNDGVTLEESVTRFLSGMDGATEGLDLKLIQGEVRMVYPGLGLYLVLPLHGDASGSLIMCCSMQGSVGRSGVQGGSTYEARDSVLVACHRETYSTDIDGKAVTEVGYILCAAPTGFMVSAQGYPGAVLHAEDADYFAQTWVEAYATAKQLDDTLRDVSYGMPTDTFAGDFVKYGSLYTFLSVCATKASMGASPMAMVEAFAFHDKIRTTARSVEDRALAVENGREPGLEGMLYYKRQAINEREGIGAVGEVAPFQKGEDTGQGEQETSAVSAVSLFGLSASLFGIAEESTEQAAVDDGAEEPLPTQVEEDQVGVFRHTELGGPMGDGHVDAMLEPFEEDALHTASNKPPTGKVSVRRTYDGKHETRATGGIDHVKTVFIPVPEQIKQHDKDLTPASLETVIPEGPYERDYQEDPDKVEDFSPFSATLEHEEFDWDNDNFRGTKVRERPDYWRTLTREQLAEEYPTLDVENAPKAMDPLDATKPHYEEPPFVNDKDPVTELERRLYALESIIRQQGDGTIVISDGHGSEIRMFRGRLTISSAADLEFRPGRDCYEFVPRRKVITAGEEVQINSDEGKVRIKAETEVDVLAGNGGTDGRILLETRTESGDGVIVKSDSDVNITGKDLYMGVKPPESGSDVGLSREQTGSIIIDARSGGTWLQGANLYGRFDDNMALSSGNAVLALSSGVYTAIANSANLALGRVVLGATEQGTLELPVINEFGVDQTSITPPSNTQLNIDGEVRARALSLTGGIFAASVAAVTGQFKNAGVLTGLNTETYEAPSFVVEPFDASSVTNAGEAIVVPSTLTDEAIANYWFQYDKPADVDQQDYILHMVRWQSMLGVGGGGAFWEPTPVKNIDDEDTYPYPGHGPNADVLIDPELGKRPLKDYIVNKASS